MEEKKLICEVNRINELMGNNLLTENVGKTVVNILQDLVKNSGEARRIFFNDTLGLEAYRRLETRLRNWQNAATGGLIPLDTVIDDLWTVSQRIPEVRLAVTDFMLRSDSSLRRQFNDFLTNREGLERMRRLTPYQLRNVLEGNIRAWFRSNPVTDSQVGILTDRLIFDVRRNLDLPPESWIDSLARKLPLKNWRYLANMLSGIFQGERRLQRRFADAAKRAENAASRGNIPQARKEAENMMAILSSAQKKRIEGFEEVYKRWKDEILRNPQFKMTQADFDKFDEFASKGGKEFWDNLTTLLPSFTEETLGPWKKLWPFKMPKTPGGFLIFNNAPATREWWERVFMTILTKSPRTLKDYIKFLKRRGVQRGTMQLLFWRFLAINVFYPVLLTLQQSVPSGAEQVMNEFYAGLDKLLGTDFQLSVDWGDAPTEDPFQRFMKNFIDSMYSTYLSFDLGEFLDQQTFTEEAYQIGSCIYKGFLSEGESAGCLQGLFNDSKRKVKEMDIPEDIKKVTLGETGVPVGETSDSGSSDDPFGKTSTENKP
jgi:hypothetical protein